MMTKRDDRKGKASPGTEYEVGYGRPPKATRFAPGQSGNPKGRPKGANGLRASINRELSRKIMVREGGRDLWMQKSDAVAKRATELALKGNVPAIRLLMTMEQDDPHDGAESPQAAAGLRPLSPEDKELLDHFSELVFPGGVSREKAGSEEP